MRFNTSAWTDARRCRASIAAAHLPPRSSARLPIYIPDARAVTTPPPQLTLATRLSLSLLHWLETEKRAREIEFVGAMAANVVAMTFTLALVVTAMSMSRASADGCDGGRLSWCTPEVTRGAPPSTTCCSELRLQNQKACLCKYVKDPIFGKFVNGPNARKVLTTCDVAIPNCVLYVYG